MKLLTGRPTCAVCGTPVESVGEDDDQFLRRLTFVARCHGAVETVRVDYDTLESVKSFGWALAFGDEARRLPPAPSRLDLPCYAYPGTRCPNPPYCFARWACCAGDPDMPT